MQIRSENSKAYQDVIIYLSPPVVLTSTLISDIYALVHLQRPGLNSITISDVFINYDMQFSDSSGATPLQSEG